jgi:protein subunit release factor B
MVLSHEKRERYNKDMRYQIPDSDETLLRECTVQVFRGTGPGGQGVNTTDSAVRLIHGLSGIVIVARRERSQLMNKRAALARLRARLEAANRSARPRLTTQPNKAAVERRLAAKRRQTRKKQQRSQPGDDYE